MIAPEGTKTDCFPRDQYFCFFLFIYVAGNFEAGD